MHIYPKNTGPIGQDAIRPSTATDTAAADGVRSVAPAPASTDRSDRVSISDAGRALAARDGSDTAALDPVRASRIRDRVLSGAYDTLEVVDAVARRLLDSGDI